VTTKVFWAAMNAIADPLAYVASLNPKDKADSTS
jgi:hypothetical protein